MGFCHHCSEQLTPKVTLTHKLKRHISKEVHQGDSNQARTLLTHFTRHSQTVWFRASTEQSIPGPESHKLSHYSSAESLFFWRGSANTLCSSEAEWHANQTAVHSLALTQTIKASAMEDCQ